MYANIYELPTQVRASLDEHDQQVYLDTYNGIDPQTEDEVKEARVKAWEACKNLPSSFSFCITASVDAVDKQKEVIDIDSVAAKLGSFIDYGGNVQDEHGDYNVATIWKYEPTVIDGRKAVNVWGNVFGGDMVYDKARKEFVSGKNSLSIAGEADTGKYTCDERGCYMKRNVQQLMEISLCTVPCNPYAKMVWYNSGAKMTKSFDGGLGLSVEQYTIHKDAQFCPIQAVKKSLVKVGIEAHAREDGVHVSAEHEGRIAKSKTLGYVRKGDELIVQSKSAMIRKAYSNCVRKGYVGEGSRILSTIPDSVLKAVARQGMVGLGDNCLVLRKNGDGENKVVAMVVVEGKCIGNAMFEGEEDASKWASEMFCKQSDETQSAMVREHLDGLKWENCIVVAEVPTDIALGIDDVDDMKSNVQKRVGSAEERALSLC